MNFNPFIFFFISAIFLVSCGNDTSENGHKKPLQDSLNTSAVTNGEIKIIEPVVDEDILVLKKDGITLTEIKIENNSVATLELTNKQFSEGKNHLSFLTNGMEDYSLAYLANNYSLSKFSSNVFEVEFLYGNNVFLAFLTDKNNISIKTNKGCVLKNAVLGAETESSFDMNQPHLFYYLPQSETNEAILDFYLVNTSIAKDGNKVKVTINEVDFIVNKWAAYQIFGLKNFENIVRIQLLDKNNKLIEGPFNDSGEREFKFMSKKSKG